MHKEPLIQTINILYFKKFLTVKNFQTQQVGNSFKVDGFDRYNHLIEINSIFSNNPLGFPIDRTGSINLPLKWDRGRLWRVPTQIRTIDDAMSDRVKDLTSYGCPINIFWSGGIDSTAVVTAFLKHAADLSQIRILYSPWSYYEHPEYFQFLKNFPEVELIDQSGVYYLNINLDGIFVSGNSGDETHASIDQSFLDTYGYNALHEPWQDFFVKKNSSSKFLEFCHDYFSMSGFEIKTVLEARWWFYISNKISTIQQEHMVPFLLADPNLKNFSLEKLFGFYDSYEYESFIYWNIPEIMSSPSYSSWKQMLKNYCFEFDNLVDWYKNKEKFHSVQLGHYNKKKIVLNDSRYIIILNNGEKIQTPNLPFFSLVELDEAYGTKLNYLFNDPDKL
jgi:hypothetical protein